MIEIDMQNPIRDLLDPSSAAERQRRARLLKPLIVRAVNAVLGATMQAADVDQVLVDLLEVGLQQGLDDESVLLDAAERSTGRRPSTIGDEVIAVLREAAARYREGSE